MSGDVRATWLLACRQVIPNAMGGDFSAVGILDSVVVARVPSVAQGFGLLLRLERDDTEPAQRVLVELFRGSGEGAQLIKETEALFMPGLAATYAFVSFRLLRALDLGPLEFSSRFKVDGGRWRKGPSHSLRVHLADGAEALAAGLDALPPLG